MQPTEYERIVLRELRRILMHPAGQARTLARRGGAHGGVRLEEIRLADSEPEHEIALLFRDLGRPMCLFGYRIKAVETPDVLRERSNPYPDPMSAARA